MTTFMSLRIYRILKQKTKQSDFKPDQNEILCVLKPTIAFRSKACLFPAWSIIPGELCVIDNIYEQNMPVCQTLLCYHSSFKGFCNSVIPYTYIFRMLCQSCLHQKYFPLYISETLMFPSTVHSQHYEQ